MTKKNGGNTEGTNYEDTQLSCSLTVENFKKAFSSSDDIVYMDLLITNRPDLSVTLIYVDGLANQDTINDNIVFSLSKSQWYDNCQTLAQAYGLTLNGALDVSSVKPAAKIMDAINAILVGKTILIFDKLERALILETIGFEKRGITAATEESTYRSGKDCFVETFRVNTATLRKKIKSHNLCIEEMVIGKQSNTRVCIAYMQNICNEDFIKKIRKQVIKINQDKAMSIRDIYTNVVKEKYTPFPTAIITEKPDVCCMSLLEGKVAVIIDELPYALVFPAVFGDFFQSSCDYGCNFIISSFFRMLRYACFILAIILPGYYVAIEAFHPRLIPYKLAVSIAASRLGTPFNINIEIIIMILAFFVLIQASLQVSRSIGGTISIVGGLVLGDAAITAGIVSPAVIVVVATAAICSMAIPNKEVNAVTWLFQLICVLFAAIFGLIGIIITLLLLFFLLAKLEPLGVPYLSPYTSTKPLQLEDSFIRFPDSLIKNRPLYLDPKNKRRKQ